MTSRYEQAANTRKRGLVGSITDRLVAGQGIGKSFGAGISDTLSAKTTGIKEKFDPLNIAKMFTGNLGMALLGKITGRKSEDMEYFLNKGRKKGEPYRQVSAPETKVGKVDTAFYTNVREGQRGALRKGDNVATVAARLVNVMKAFYEKETLNKELAHNFDEEIHSEDQRRHDDLIAAIKKIQGQEISKKDIEKIKKEEQKPEVPKEMPPVTGEPTTKQTPTSIQAPTTATTKVEETINKVTPVKPTVTQTPSVEPVLTPKTITTPKIEKPSVVTATKEPVLTPPPTTKPSAVSSAVKAAAGVAGTVAVINDALAEVGITNPFAKQAILGNVNKESSFQTVGENLNYTTAKRVREVFPTVTGQMTDEQIQPYLNNPEGLSELVYGYQTKKGKELGNTEPGDAWKYRGRGLIQLTGKDNYARIGKELKLDLVKNPELVNDPVIAPKVVAVYVKQRLKDKVNSFTNQKDANRDITQAIVGRVDLNKGIGAQQLAKVENYTTANSGEKIYASSTQNQELKEQASVTNIAVNNTKTIINTSNREPKVLSGPQVDDYPILASNIS